MARSMEFGLRLADGICRVSSCEDKPISAIHDELGYALGREGGSALYYWRKGNVPRLAVVETLARELMRRSDLDEAWLRAFLEGAAHPYVESFCSELFPAPDLAAGGQQNGAHALLPAVYTNGHGVDQVNGHHYYDYANKNRSGYTANGSNGVVHAAVPGKRGEVDHSSPTGQQNDPPRKRYSTLVGRRQQVEEVVRNLADADGRWLVGIDGMGGSGKTALACEVVVTALKRRLFDGVVWVEMGGAGSVVEALVDALVLSGYAIDRGDPLAKCSGVALVRSVLAARRLLVVIDGFENVQGSQAEAVRQLQGISGPSRALLVSRYRFTGDVYAVRLGRLGCDDAVALIRQEARERGVRRVATASDEALEEVVTLTGGSPLAIQVVVRELGHLPLAVVKQRLCGSRPLGDDWGEDEYSLLFERLFRWGWAQLTADAQQLLLGLDPLPFAYGSAVGSDPGSDLMQCVDELWRFCFLEVAAPSVEAGSTFAGSINGCGLAELDQIAYEMQALTRYFVESIRQDSEEKRQ